MRRCIYLKELIRMVYQKLNKCFHKRLEFRGQPEIKIGVHICKPIIIGKVLSDHKVCTYSEYHAPSK